MTMYKRNKSIKAEQLPAIRDGKKRRLVARLKSFKQTGSMEESIQVLRKRLNPFVKVKKVKRDRFKSQMRLDLEQIKIV